MGLRKIHLFTFWEKKNTWQFHQFYREDLFILIPNKSLIFSVLVAIIIQFNGDPNS